MGTTAAQPVSQPATPTGTANNQPPTTTNAPPQPPATLPASAGPAPTPPSPAAARRTLHEHAAAQPAPLPLIFDPDGNEIPKEFDPRYLPKYTAHNIGWWDETHPKLKHGTGGAQHGAAVEVSYPLGAQGNIDTRNGTYSEKESKNIVPKYHKEIRLALGVAMRLKYTGQGCHTREEAIRPPPH